MLKTPTDLRREATAFLTDYMLRKSLLSGDWADGYCHVFPTVVPELYGIVPGLDKNRDCIVDLTLIKFLFHAFLEAICLLGEEKEEQELAEKCRNIPARIPHVPNDRGQALFCDVWGEDPEIIENTPNTIKPVFPGENISFGCPDRQSYERAARTWKKHRNEGGNDLVYYHLQGVRLGILDLERFKRQVKYCLHPNKTCTDRVLMSGGRYEDDRDFDFVKYMGVWVENFSLPAVISNCLVTHQKAVRFFPNWDLQRAASFYDHLAVGSTLVSDSSPVKMAR